MKKGTIAVLSGILGAMTAAIATGVMEEKVIKKKAEKVDKFKSYYNMLNQWLILKQEGKSLEKYFIDNGYKTIAIYGMGEMGNRLYEELKNSNIEVLYTVDKNAASTYAEVGVIDPEEDDFEPVDVIIVTASYAFQEIEEILSSKIDFPIISLEEVIYEI